MKLWLVWTHRLLLLIVVAAALALPIAYGTSNPHWIGPLLSVGFLSMALAVRGFQHGKELAFTFWVVAAVAFAMTYPQWFIGIGDFKYSQLMLPLLQLIMFGMGTTLSVQDFARVVRMPKGVLVGIVCQFSIMPLVGFGLARAFQFPPEIAAGVVLVGSSPSGLASNVMAYLSKANLALSVTLTSVATLLAPFMTPLLMKLFAGAMIEVDVGRMMWNIMQLVIFPVLGGLAVHHLLRDHAKWLDRTMPFVSMVGIILMTVITIALGREDLLHIGGALILACVIHNLCGYVLGYAACRAMRLDTTTCRTIALEVGLQNSGMALGIAKTLNQVGTLGLAPAVFGPIMNTTGSILANWWRTRPTNREP